MLRTGMATAVGVSNISVVYLYVRDMERSLAFYRDLLGIPLEGDERWVETTFPGGTRFALHAAHEGIGELSSGTVNISLEVEDAGAAAELLRERGADVRDAVRDSWGTAVDVVDPDGYVISLFQQPG
jgi:lactoylglutathione lyase